MNNKPIIDIFFEVGKVCEELIDEVSGEHQDYTNLISRANRVIGLCKGATIILESEEVQDD